MNLIYNFTQYLIDEFPTEVFYCNAREQNALQLELPDNCVLVQDTGGTCTLLHKVAHGTIQIVVRNIETPSAQILAHTLYLKLNGVFGLILPETVVKGTIYPRCAVAEIRAIQRPTMIGLDEKGRSVFTNNYKLIFAEV